MTAPKSKSDKRAERARAQDALMEWLILPEPDREPPTLRELALLLEVSVDTFDRWRKEPSFLEEYDRRWRSAAGDPSRIRHVIDKLYEAATEGGSKGRGDSNAQRMYLEWAREFARVADDQAPVDLREMSDEELFEKARALVGK